MGVELLLDDIAKLQKELSDSQEKHKLLKQHHDKLVDMIRELTDYRSKANEIFGRLVKAGIRMPELQEIICSNEKSQEQDKPIKETNND